jgi:hypothetical protein
MLRSGLGVAYRDKKVVGVFVRFSCAMSVFLLLILHHDLPSHFAINPYFVIAVYRKTAIDLPLFF